MSSTEKIIDDYMDGYLTKYCKEWGCTREEAKQHAIVKAVEAFYRESPPKGDSPMPRTELDIGCKGGC